MKKLLYSILSLITLFNVYLASDLVRNGEVNFFNDVARDFLLLQELDYKKIILIGPRSSTINLFHGPLWTYINYPAYVIGNGNPVIVAWFWIILSCIFLTTGFFMVKKLFGIFPAFAFIALASTKLAAHIDGIFHAEATFFFMPMLLFTILMYIKNRKILYLILHVLAIAIFIQLEIGVGLQLLILSMALIIWIIYKYKHWKHLYAFLFFPVFLLNFIVFDLRNDLRMTKAIFSTGGSFHFFITIESWLQNRINNLVSLQLFNNVPNNLFIYIVFAVVMIATILEIRKKSKFKYAYLLFLYYYFGYIVLSFFNKGILLEHYVYLLIPLTILWLVSFLAGKYKLIFLFIVCIVYYLSFNSAVSYTASRKSLMGKNYNSWISLTNVAKEVINMQKKEEFGYFVFAPDALAYQPRYAMIYHFKAGHAKALEYMKKPVTYVIAAPPPADNPYMTHVWWRKIPVGISSEPAIIKKFPSGFTIEKFNLSPEEQRVAHDKAIELGIHFR